MEQDDTRSDAREIVAVLAHASVPDLPAGAMDRLMARIAETPPQAEVIAAAPRAPFGRTAGRTAVRRPAWRLAAAVPLAASLALGLWLGAHGKMDFVMPSAVTGGMAWNDDAPVDDLGGVGDAYAEEGTT